MILDNMVKEIHEDAASTEGSCIQDINALMENYIYDAITSKGEDAVRDFIASEECKALQEVGILGKKTIVRMAKADDLSRRIKLAVLQKAKEDNDPNYLALKKVIHKKKALSAKLMQKYQNRVRTDAIKSQRALIKISPNYFTRPLHPTDAQR